MSPASRQPDRSAQVQRTAAVALVLLQAVEIGWLMGMRTVGMLAAMLGLLGWLAPRVHLLREFSVPRLAIGGAAAFLILYTVYPQELGRQAYIGTDLAFVLATFCVGVQILTLFSSKFHERLPSWYLLLSGLGLIIGADARMSNPEVAWIMGLVLIYLLAWTLFASHVRLPVAARPSPFGPRGLVLAAVLLVVAATTWVSAGLLRSRQGQLERWFMNSLIATDFTISREGFSGTGGIGDITRSRLRNAREVSLRIQSPERPGYLRGQAFHRYAGEQWSNTSPAMELYAARRVWEGGNQPSQGRWYVSLGADAQPRLDDDRRMTIWPRDNSVRRFLFLTPDTSAVICNLHRLTIQQPRIIMTVEGQELDSYTLLRGTSRAVADEPPEEFLDVPEDVTGELDRLAAELQENAANDLQRIRRVESHFHDNFTYRLGVRTPEHRDRLQYFLAESREGHCEYFATSAAILLRMMGVPARYVTGFVVNERGAVAGEWLARRGDAHAWVEAFDRDRQEWVLVEATPPDGVPVAEEPTTWEAWSDAAGRAWTALREFMTSGGLWSRLARQLWVVPVALVLAAVLTIGRKIWRQRSMARGLGRDYDSPEVRLVQERQFMDRWLGRRGLQREPQETLLTFADRLESAPGLPLSADLANWYRAYNQLRFRDTPLASEDYHRLRLLRRSLSRTGGPAREMARDTARETT